MNRKLIRTFCISVIMFLSIFLINIDGVKACSCYYRANSYAELSDGQGGTIRNYTLDVVEMEFTASDAYVVRSCRQTKSQEEFNNEQTYDAMTNCPDGSKQADRGNPFDVDSGKIEKGSCSISACNSANIYLRNSQIVTEKTDVRLGALSKEDFQATIDAANEEEGKRISIDPTYILKWASKQKGINEANSSNASGYSNCDLIPSSIISFLKNLFLVIQIIGVLLLIIMSMIEFIKALTASDEDGIKGAIKNTFRRIIVTVILLILPMIIIFVLNIVNDNRYQKDENGNYVIGTDGNPLCE